MQIAKGYESFGEAIAIYIFIHRDNIQIKVTIHLN
jgi:hypothetical protein